MLPDMHFKSAALILCLFPITLAAQGTSPIVCGYITSIDSDLSFAVAGWPVRLDPKTTFAVRDGNLESPLASFTPYIGEFVDLFGSAPGTDPKARSSQVGSRRFCRYSATFTGPRLSTLCHSRLSRQASIFSGQTAAFSAYRRPLRSSSKTNSSRSQPSQQTFGLATRAHCGKTGPFSSLLRRCERMSSKATNKT